MRPQVRELINGSEGAGQFTARGGLLDFDLFVRLMRQKARDEDTEGELKDAFRVLDKSGQGWIDTTQMMLVCRVRAMPQASVNAPMNQADRPTETSRTHPPTPQALGEDLSKDEVRAMVSEAISNFDDRIYYDGFVKTMISKAA